MCNFEYKWQTSSKWHISLLFFWTHRQTVQTLIRLLFYYYLPILVQDFPEINTFIYNCLHDTGAHLNVHCLQPSEDNAAAAVNILLEECVSLISNGCGSEPLPDRFHCSGFISCCKLGVDFPMFTLKIFKTNSHKAIITPQTQFVHLFYDKMNGG